MSDIYWRVKPKKNMLFSAAAGVAAAAAAPVSAHVAAASAAPAADAGEGVRLLTVCAMKDWWACVRVEQNSTE